MTNTRAVRTLLGAIIAGPVASLLAGCTQEPREVPPTDCSVEAGYEFHPLFLSAPTGSQELDNWYVSGDKNAQEEMTYEADAMGAMDPMVVTTVVKKAVDSDAYVTRSEYLGEPVCDHPIGKRFTFGLNHDWGAVGGRWAQLGGADADASAYEGFSFWASSLYDRSIELNWADVHAATPPDGETDFEKTCIPDVLGTTKAPNPNFVDENGVPKANSCGSLFTRRVIMDKGWKFYTIPFSEFIQIYRDPRWKPEGLLTSAMRIFSFRVPKDAFVDVSFVNFAWYRKASD